MNDLIEADLFDKFDDPSEAWNSKAMGKRLSKEWSEWIMTARNWRSFITLTFRNETYPDVAKKDFQFLVRSLNQEVFGKHYMNIVGPSYFSYVLGIEYQRRDVIHFHVLVDRPVNYEKIHNLWNYMAGFAHIKPIQNYSKAIEYVSKYASKSGELEPFFAKEIYTPKQLPIWWKEAEMNSSNLEEEKTNPQKPLS
jgi:hypothetical protein